VDSIGQEEDLPGKPDAHEPVATERVGISRRSTKSITHYWGGTLVIATALLVWAPRLSGPINLRWDASTYYVLGTALAEAKGYRLLNEPGEIEAVQYPPLLPLIVAAHQRVMGTSDYFKVGSVLRITYFVLSILFLMASYAVTRRLVSPLYSLLIGVITVLSFGSFLWPSEVLYTEMPFAAVTMGFVLCYYRSDECFFGVLSAVLGVAGYLLRTAGLALLLAWIGDSLIRRRFRQAAIRAAIAALPVLLWQVHIWRVTASDQYHHPNYSYQRAAYQYANVTYSKNSSLIDPFRPEQGHVQFHDFIGRLARNIAFVPIALGQSAVDDQGFVPHLLGQLEHMLHVRFSTDRRAQLRGAFLAGLCSVGVLALAGAILVATGRYWFLSLYFAITIVMVVATPWAYEFWRYLAPVTPLTLLFFFVALIAIRNQLKRVRWGKIAGALVITVPSAAILLVQIVVATHIMQTLRPVSYYDATGRERVFKLIAYGSEWHALDPAFEWIKRNTPRDAVIATTVPHLAYLRTGHKAVLPPFVSDPNTARRLLDEVPVHYIVVDRFGRPGVSERYATTIVAHNSTDWRLVFTASDGKTSVYERVNRKSGPDSRTFHVEGTDMTPINNGY
jgi:hypothetical protein